VLDVARWAFDIAQCWPPRNLGSENSQVLCNAAVFTDRPTTGWAVAILVTEASESGPERRVSVTA